MTAADTIKQISVTVKRCADCGARFGIDAAFCPFDGGALSTATWDRDTDARSNVIVDHRYEVEEALGEGGMGTVYKVRHLTLDRFFAMKVLRKDLALDEELAARFVQEARATAAAKHPGIVAISDFGTMSDGVPYFVMELLHGETVAGRLRKGPIHPTIAAKIGKRIAEALVAAHAAGVVHRDLKPDNVFLVGRTLGKAPEDDIRIVDFGAAKIIGGSKLTRPGIVFGTPYYMSPEQASGGEVDGRADVYSLGILLFEMVSGQVPFLADSYMEVLEKHLFEPPPPLVVPGDAGLGAIVAKALVKNPDERWPSAAALAAALGTVLEEPPAEAPSLVTPRGTLRMPLGTTEDGLADAPVLALAARRRLFVLGGLALAVVVGVVAITLLAPRVSRPAAPSSSAASAGKAPGTGAGRHGGASTTRSPSIPPRPPPSMAAPVPGERSGAPGP